MKPSDGEESTDVVEMDAMDVVEWERDQHTPVATEQGLAALVKKSAQREDKAQLKRPPATPRPTRNAMPVPLGASPAGELPRATAPAKLAEAAVAESAPSSRVPNATIPTPQPLMEQLLKTPTKHTTQRSPRLAAQTVPTPPAVQQTLVTTTEKKTPAPAPAVTAEVPAGGWEDLDDSWDESPKSSSTKTDAQAYSAPTTPRVTTSNTVRRGRSASESVVRKTGAMPAAPPPTAIAGESTQNGAVAKSNGAASSRPTGAQPAATAQAPIANGQAKPPQGPIANGQANPRPIANEPATAPIANGQARAAAPQAPMQAKPATAPQIADGQAKPATAPLPAIAKKPATAQQPPIAQGQAKPATPAQAKPVERAAAAQEPAVRPSEPALLPPPPIAKRDDEWDGLAPSKPSPRNPRPVSDFGDDADREPSVIIDLNAKQVAAQDLDWSLAAAALAADAIGGSGPQMPIQTSELNTTASGIFVMPTAAAPMGRSVGALKTNPAARAYRDEDAPTSARVPPEDDLEVPVWTPPKAAAPADAPAPTAAPADVAPLPPPPEPPAAHMRQAAPPSAPAAPARPPGVAFAFAPATQQAAQPPRAPSVAELGWDHDPAIPQPLANVEQTERRIVPRTLLATVLPTPNARRLAVIIGSAAALLVVLLVIVLASGGSSSPASATPATPIAETPAPAPPPAAEPPKPEPPKPVEVAAADPTPPATAEPPQVDAPKPVIRRTAKPAKPLVLDYDKPKSDAPAPAPTPDQALARARAAYAAGNQHLFAGDADDAIASYKQALAIYPGYVAGYRGLGLAYAQRGDRDEALKAFKKYVGLVPNAKDVGLIQKRIARLSGQ